MASGTTQRNTEPLSCSICQDTLQDITLSSCFHTFCRKCLDGHIRSTKGGKTNYQCPICNTSITLSSELTSDSSKHHLHRPEDVYPDSGPWNEFCDICRGRVPAVNRCLQCNESFCENCSLVHLRMKASRYHGHRVVPLWGRGSRTPFDDHDKYWPRHRNEEIIVFCKQCDVLLCLICKLMEHEHHVTRLVSEEAADMRNDLTGMLQHQIGVSESLHTEKDMLQSNKTHIASGLDNELAKLRRHAANLERQIERERMDKERELIQHYENLHKDTADAYETVNENHEEFAAVSRKAQNLLDSDDDVTVVREGPRIYEKLRDLERKRTPAHAGIPAKTFVPGDTEGDQMQQIMGYVTDRGSIPSARSREPLHRSAATSMHLRLDCFQVNASIVSSFQLPFNDRIGYVNGIAPVGNNKAWISLLDHPEVTLVDHSGSIHDQVDIGEPCGEVAPDLQGGCFTSCPQSRSVKRIKIFGSTKLETTLHELKEDPHGMATRKPDSGSEQLFICFSETGDVSASRQRGCIRFYSFSGEEEFSVMSSMQAPVRIDADSSSELLCVSDHRNGLVAIFDKTGQSVKALYSGNNDTELFKPLGVCFDPFGGVMIADWQTGAIQRITIGGKFIQNLLVNLDGPQSIAVDDSLQLWVGCKHGHVQVYSMH